MCPEAKNSLSGWTGGKRLPDWGCFPEGSDDRRAAFRPREIQPVKPVTQLSSPLPGLVQRLGLAGMVLPVTLATFRSRAIARTLSRSLVSEQAGARCLT